MTIPQTPFISVVVVAFNSGAHLERCLRALAGQTFSDFEAIVVDNASSDGAYSAARSSFAEPRFRYVEFGQNLGFAAANNRAVNMAAGRWLAFLNPDAFPEPRWLESLIAAAGRHPDTTLFGSTQISDRDKDRIDGCGDAYFATGLPWRGGHGRPIDELPSEDRETFSPCAAAALVRADLFRQLGGFDEAFFCYCEDVDLGFRARLAGHRCIQVRDAVVHHVGGGSSGGGTFARRLGIRNLVWTFFKNMPAALMPLLLPLHLLTLAGLVLRATGRGEGMLVAKAIGEALNELPSVLRRRTKSRVAGVGSIAAAITWNPCAYLRRAPSTQPIE
jgi:N-acetylglucosaminyl-diphospho-decaprenol L-rhamnosyltransferase